MLFIYVTVLNKHMSLSWWRADISLVFIEWIFSITEHFMGVQMFNNDSVRYVLHHQFYWDRLHHYKHRKRNGSKASKIHRKRLRFYAATLGCDIVFQSEAYMNKQVFFWFKDSLMWSFWQIISTKMPLSLYKLNTFQPSEVHKSRRYLLTIN